jgi:hypothetical protein
MADDRRAMYNGFSKKSGHSENGFELSRNSLTKLLLVAIVLQSAPAQFVRTTGF